MTKENFIQEFKQMVISGVYYNMPKDYRKSSSYSDMSIDQKFRQALQHSSIERVLEDIIGDYYEKINNYEEILGY